MITLLIALLLQQPTSGVSIQVDAPGSFDLGGFIAQVYDGWIPQDQVVAMCQAGQLPLPKVVALTFTDVDGQQYLQVVPLELGSGAGPCVVETRAAGLVSVTFAAATPSYAVPEGAKVTSIIRSRPGDACVFCMRRPIPFSQSGTAITITDASRLVDGDALIIEWTSQ